MPHVHRKQAERDQMTADDKSIFSRFVSSYRVASLQPKTSARAGAVNIHSTHLIRLQCQTSMLRSRCRVHDSYFLFLSIDRVATAHTNLRALFFRSHPFGTLARWLEISSLSILLLSKLAYSANFVVIRWFTTLFTDALERDGYRAGIMKSERDCDGGKKKI